MASFLALEVAAMAKSIIWLEKVEVPACTWTPSLLAVRVIIKLV